MLFALQLKCEVAERLCPAPVEPVIPVVYTSFSKPALAKGNKPN